MIDARFQLDPDDCCTRVASLTPRERQVCEGLSFGRPLKTICAELGIAVATSRVFVWKAKKKLGVQNIHGIARVWFCAAQTKVEKENGHGD